MVKAVDASERFQAYILYIAKVSKILGITKTRAVFEHALQNIAENQILILGRKYA
jgi:hypothetical protein